MRDLFVATAWLLGLLGACRTAPRSSVPSEISPAPLLVPDTTSTTRLIGDLELTVRVSPSPRFTGDTAEVILRLENRGQDSTRILKQHCYRHFRGAGVVPLAEVVCAVAPHEAWLAPGGAYETRDWVRFIGPHGRHTFDLYALATPEVWIEVPFTLRARS